MDAFWVKGNGTMASRRQHANEYLSRPAPATSNLTDRDMEYATLEAREASFAPPTKRSKAGWPHKSPSPHDLAVAGFFKTSMGKDNCQCFMCDRQLDGWEEDDDALAEHLKHGADCAWALLMSLQQEREYDTSNMDDPTGENLTDARRTTFETIGWPHEGKRGWSCKTEKMVEAGWHFAPTTECEDYVSCVYCKLSLDGWERKDDPWDNHYRRSPDCPFFHFAGSTAPSKRPKAKKGRASKSSRISSQSNMSAISQADESTGNFEVLGVDTTMEEIMDNSIVSIQSTTSTATTKSKRKGPTRAKGAPTKKAKTNKPTAKEVEPESEVELDIQPTQEVEITEAPPKPKAKKPKAKKKAPTPEPEPIPEPAIEDEEILEVEPEVESEPEVVVQDSPKPKKRLSRSKKQEPDPETAEEDPSYPVLPQETPDDFQDAVEERQAPSAEEVTHHTHETGPPERETTPIPAKQISPLKAQSNPPRPTISPVEASNRRSSRRSRASESKAQTPPSVHHQTTRSPSQPSDVENLPPSSRPERVRPPLSSPGAPPPEWTPIDIEKVFEPEDGQALDLFGGVVNGELSDAEKEMTVQQWVEHVAGLAEANLSAEGERVVSIFEREGQRALVALEGIQIVG